MTQWGQLSRAAMATGIRLFPKRALLHLSIRYLCPESNGVRYSCSEWVESCFTEIAMCVVTLLSSVRLGVGRPRIFGVVLVMRMSF